MNLKGDPGKIRFVNLKRNYINLKITLKNLKEKPKNIDDSRISLTFL